MSQVALKLRMPPRNRMRDKDQRSQAEFLRNQSKASNPCLDIHKRMAWLVDILCSYGMQEYALR